MKVLVQRAKDAKVIVNEEIVGQIDHGVMLLVGITHNDDEAVLNYVVDKVANLRIFEDNQGKMNHSLIDVNGKVLSISQFTLYGDCRKGRRPNYMNAAKPEIAEELYDMFNKKLSEKGIQVETGSFGAMMDVQFTNVGPVTLMIEKENDSL
ncbi:D-tyrosyl-tRNA(Tyr) deacylase [Lottiidibacillus patelloidae]|uniref:D-aminoacyl-tRNA deacylase n=1 Tax=Lottiidibacillus patelloidae TaxID=2670334 RepID=A0A263BVP4_9BACI|nr:D-aminoacyl-tRNA deacylase [Lottiidibacillus patelloidae]OZM57823.1 D-tyrosyl-tRNA(Tyr) deacylase [Lottiidibacillus patelloidae]